MTTARPELGTVNVGDRVYVRRSPNDMHRRPVSELYIPATVTKAARVWIELEMAADGDLPAWSIYRWRMRRDTQNEGTQYSGSDAAFVTPAQREYDEAAREAREFLAKQGIRLDTRSPWSDRLAELAGLIRPATAPEGTDHDPR